MTAYEKEDIILYGDCRETLPKFTEKARTCITSPPYYGLRDYGGEAHQIGQEETPEEYVEALVDVFRKVKDCLTDDGTLWLNIGDTYYNYRPSNNGGYGGTGKNINRGLPEKVNKRSNKFEGIKEKDLIGIPWMLAFALRADGWYLRQDIIWSKPNVMPESVKDRCTKSHEYIFLLSKSQHYYFDNEVIKEEAVGFETKNKRSVWTVNTKPYQGAHFAVFPSELIEPCVLAGSEKGDYVLDPFLGSGTTGLVAMKHGRFYMGCELNEDYSDLIDQRVAQRPLPF